MWFCNVPGFKHFIRRYGVDEIIRDLNTAGESTSQDSWEALKQLAERTGKPTAELVRQTRVLIFPEEKFADFWADLIQRGQQWRYSVNLPPPYLWESICCLSEKQVRLLQENPERFFKLYGEEKNNSAEFWTISSNSPAGKSATLTNSSS
jgi:hypothetical protein